MTTWSPSLALEPALRALKSCAVSAKLPNASSIAASSALTTIFSNLMTLRSTSGISGSFSYVMSTFTSSPAFQSSFVILTSGCIAGRSPQSSKCLFIAPSMDSCMASPIRRSPNCFFSRAIGTLPLRKPFISTSGCASISFVFTVASNSAAVTMIEYARFRPSLSVSVTCMCAP